MSRIGRTDIEELIALEAPDAFPCASLYVPTAPSGADAEAAPIRLKNALADAEAQMRERGIARDDAQRMLSEPRQLLSSTLFWRHQRQGLAIFVGPGLHRRFLLAFSVPERAVVGNAFHIKPLLPALEALGTFYVLGLSKNRVRLYRGDDVILDEVTSRALPESLRDVVGEEATAAPLQFQTGAQPGPTGERHAVFHGHLDTGKASEDVRRFLRQVDRGVRKAIEEPQAPMVIAAVRKLASLYRGLSEHESICDGFVEGNPDDLRPGELHDQAVRVVWDSRRPWRRDALERFAERVGTGLASDDLETVVSAACDGRVGELVAATDTCRWGRFDPDARAVHLSDGERQVGDDDLIDLAVRQTLLHGGEAHGAAQAAMPGGRLVAGLFRYGVAAAGP